MLMLGGAVLLRRHFALVRTRLQSVAEVSCTLRRPSLVLVGLVLFKVGIRPIRNITAGWKL